MRAQTAHIGPQFLAAPSARGPEAMYSSAISSTVDVTIDSVLYELCARADEAYAYIRRGVLLERARRREAEEAAAAAALGVDGLPPGGDAPADASYGGEESDESSEDFEGLEGAGSSGSSGSLIHSA